MSATVLAFVPALPPSRGLRWTAVAFGVAFALHALDHARRGLDASPTLVAVVGAVQAVAVAVAVAMVWTGRRGAAPVAVAVGLVSVLLVVFGHLVPGGTDSYLTPPATNVTTLSWASAYAEIAAAVALVVTGLALLARRRGAAAPAA